MRRRVEAIVTIVIAVLVFAAAGYVVIHKDSVKNAGETPGFSLSSSPTSKPSTSSSPSSSSSSSSSKPVIVFLGDDYTDSSGASSKAKGFVMLLASKLSATVHSESVDGGGYAKSSSSGDTYADRVAAIVKDKPQLVVVTGGRNDTADDSTTLANDAKDLFTELHKKLPDAKLVAVAPFWGDSDPPSELEAVATAIEDGVKAGGGEYLDISDPLHNHSNYMANDSDPNDKGYAAIADALETPLKSSLAGT